MSSRTNSCFIFCNDSWQESRTFRRYDKIEGVVQFGLLRTFMAGILSLWQRRGVRQLVKFCLVGASSAVVDNATKWVLLNNFRDLPWWMAATIAFGFGLTNGFFWNRHITFRARNYGNAKKQYVKFAITNTIGLVLNLTITKMFLMLLTRQVVHGQNPEAHIVIYASLMALPFVAIWNFSAAKYWTFREPKETPPPATASGAVASETTGA